jgi:hypothetical protein
MKDGRRFTLQASPSMGGFQSFLSARERGVSTETVVPVGPLKVTTWESSCYLKVSNIDQGTQQSSASISAASSPI